jgi:hypothetical protein
MTLTQAQLDELDAAIHLCAWCKKRAEALVPAEPSAPRTGETAPPPAPPATARQRERAIAGKRETRKDA